MKILQFFRMPLQRLGLFQPGTVESSSSQWKRVMVLIILLQLYTAPVIFLLFEAGTFREYADSFYIFATASLKVCTFSVTLWKRAKFFKLMNDYENIINERIKKSTSEVLYAETNDLVERRCWITYLSFIKLTLPGVMFPNFILSIILYFSADLGRNGYSLAFAMWLPYDWRTPLGCIAAFVHQFVSFFYLLHCCTFIVSFLIGSCGILFTFTKDMKRHLQRLNSHCSPRQQLEILREFVEFHAKAKQYVYDFEDYFAIVITAYYTWSIATICSTLLVVQMQMETGSDFGHIIEMIKPLILCFWSFVQVYMFCDFGENVTNGFASLNETIFACNWYTSSTEIQKMVIVIMISMQKTMIIRGFGNIPSTREAFKKAINGGFSYFMVLRSIK